MDNICFAVVGKISFGANFLSLSCLGHPLHAAGIGLNSELKFNHKPNAIEKAGLLSYGSA